MQTNYDIYILVLILVLHSSKPKNYVNEFAISSKSANFKIKIYHVYVEIILLLFTMENVEIVVYTFNSVFIPNIYFFILMFNSGSIYVNLKEKTKMLYYLLERGSIFSNVRIFW